MATTLDTLVQRSRRFMRDFPVAQDALSASITSVATTATVSSGPQFNQSGNQIVGIDYEAFLLKSVSANTLTVTTADGQELNARVITADPDNDLAVIKADGGEIQCTGELLPGTAAESAFCRGRKRRITVLKE